MIIFPAVDIQKNKAVRLTQGKADQSTVFLENPIDAAKMWEDKGAKYLHIVDLDGAFDGNAISYNTIEKICSSIKIPVQLGGGIRNEDTVKAYLDAGVTRLIIGTMALEDPKLFQKLCEKYTGKIGISLDADNGKLKSRGWIKDTSLEINDILPRIQEDGASFIIFTDISRDGMQTGINIKTLKEIAQNSKIPVIAAGGVATLQDIKDIYPLTKSTSLIGAISGKALYTGTLDLIEANNWISSQK